MARVIQDSDDERELHSPVRAQDEFGLTKGSVKESNSSGDLLRGIHAAQVALVAQTANPYLDGISNMPGDGIASPMSSSKRTKTIKTYGSASKRTRTLADDEADRFDALKYNCDRPQLGLGEGWLPPTLREDFQEHNPYAMFSELSSTIPDNTMSQQRIIQQALEANRFTVSDTQGKAEHTQQSESSIPWSAYHDTPEKNPASPRAGLTESASLAPSQLLSSINAQPQTVSAHGQFSETPQGTSHNADGLAYSKVRSQTLEVPQKTQSVMTTSMQSGTPPLFTQVQRLSDIEVHGELVIEQNERRSKGESGSKVDHTKKRSATPRKTEPHSDDLWVGMPEEQHKPRAPRSRSAQITDDEHLKAAEQTLKPKSKRRKTTHDLAQYGRVAPCHDLQTSLVDIAKVPPNISTAAATLANDTESMPGTRNKENESPAVTKQKTEDRKVPVPTVRATLVEVSIPPIANTKRKLETQSEQLVVKGARKEPSDASPPPSSISRRAAKGSRSHTIAISGHSQRRKVLDSDESDAEISPIKQCLDDIDELNILANPAAKMAADMLVPEEKKRGRGRPRKSETIKVASVTANELDITKKAPTLQNKDCGGLDDELHMNHRHRDISRGPSATSQPGYNNSETMTAEILPQPASSSSKPSMLPDNPEQPEKRSATPPMKTPEGKTVTTGSHSPISKGKVPYRVGLSKRARIAPLLRVVKK